MGRVLEVSDNSYNLLPFYMNINAVKKTSIIFFKKNLIFSLKVYSFMIS